MAIFRDKGKQNTAKIFLKDFNPANGNSYFLGIGNAVTDPTLVPAISSDCVQTDYTTWDNLFLLSQVVPSDVSLMLKKYVWTPNTRYEAFNKDLNQAALGEKFYVFNESNSSVYLCMAAPPSKTNLSTNAPIGTTTELEVKPDGYAWKFLYTISEDKLEKFNYPGYIPIEQIGTDLYTDDRILQQQVSIASIKGSIESITLETQGNVYAAAANVNFNNSIYVVAESVGPVGNDEPYVLINPLGRNELILTNGFYNDKYVLTFSNGYTGVINSSSIEPTTGYLKLTLCEVYTPNGNQVPPEQETFSILPRVKITGNGTGAYAIPVLTSQKYISNIKVLDGGLNYSYVLVDIPQVNGTIIKPIMGLNGIGSDIIELFNVKHVMISKEIKPLLSLSAEDPVLYTAPENTGVVYEGDQYTDIVSANTYYTQVSLVKNPKVLINNLEQIGGISYSEEREMVLEAIDPKIVIIVGTKNVPYLNPNNFFQVGDMIVRGPQGALDQFKAIVKQVSVSSGVTTITCDLMNGALETYAGYQIRNFKLASNTNTDGTTDSTDSQTTYESVSVALTFEDCENNCSENIAHYYENAFRAGNFAYDDVVLGSTSLSGAEIVKLPQGYGYVNPLYPTRVKIIVKKTDRTFLVSRYENGVYVPGEVVSSFVITEGKPELRTRGRLVSISEPLTKFDSVNYGCAYILKCRINRGTGAINTPDALVNIDGVSLETNTLIRQGLDGSVGKIIRVGLPVGTDTEDLVYVYVNNYNGEFFGATDNTDPLYAINDLYEPSTYQNMKLFVEEVIYEPSVLRYSGNILYINDVGPVQRKIENSEYLKLLVEF